MSFDLEEYDGSMFEGLDQREAALKDVTFYECHFENCQFNEASFKRSRFVGCVFSRCDLSMVDVTDAEFSDVRFEHTFALGINWSVVSEMRLLPVTISFLNCTLNYCTFKGLDLSNSVFEDCVAHEVEFRGVKLIGASFAGTDLAGSSFHDSDLSKVNLKGAKNYRIDVRTNRVQGAQASFPEVIGLLAGLEVGIDM